MNSGWKEIFIEMKIVLTNPKFFQIWNKFTLGPYINADTPVLSMIKCVSRYFLADVQLVR